MAIVFRATFVECFLEETWTELLDYMQSTSPLVPGKSSLPSIKFTVDDGRTQWVVIRPLGAGERARVELITAFAK